MLQNAYFLAKIGADTAENEQHCAEILPKTGNYPTGFQASFQADGVHDVVKDICQIFGKISAKFSSFSAVSAPIFARKYAFCSIYQNLPDSQAEIFGI